MTQQTAARRLVAEVRQLHTAPVVATQLLALTQDDDFDIEELVTCLERDPALTTQVLKLVNSSKYALTDKVTHLRRAVMYLGQRSLRMIAISFSLTERLTRGIGGELYQDYWKRALTMAAAASEIVRRSQSFDRHESYIAGLLADVGILVLAQARNDEYAALYNSVGHSQSLIEHEVELFECGHPAVGAAYLEEVGLPESLVNSTLFHHEDLEEHRTQLPGLTYAVNCLADVLWSWDYHQLSDVRRLLEARYNLDLDGFVDLTMHCKEDVTSSANVFCVELQEMIDAQQLIDQARRLQSEVAVDPSSTPSSPRVDGEQGCPAKTVTDM